MRLLLFSLLIVCINLAAEASLNCLRVKIDGAFDKANLLLAEATESDEVELNRVAAEKLVANGEFEDCEVGHVLERFIAMSSAYSRSCSEQNVDTVAQMFQVMQLESDNNPLKAPQSNRRLNKLVISMHNSFVKRCLSALVLENERKRIPIVYSTFLALVSDRKEDRDNYGESMRRIVRDLLRTDFNDLRESNSAKARLKWALFFLRMSLIHRDNLYSHDPKTGRVRVSEREVEKLYKKYVAQSCDKLASSWGEETVSLASKLVTKCNLDSVDLNVDRHSKLVPVAVSGLICEQLRQTETPSPELISRITKTLSGRLWLSIGRVVHRSFMRARR